MKWQQRVTTWLICSVLGILTGCATTEPASLWSDIERAEVEIQQPRELPRLPAPVSSTDNTVTFDLSGFATLNEYATIAEGNYAISQANAEALAAQSKAFNHLLEAGEWEERLSQLREKLLREERRAHFIDNWFHRGIIILGLGAALL